VRDPAPAPPDSAPKQTAAPDPAPAAPDPAPAGRLNLEVMHEKLIHIEKLEEEMHILASRLSGQISELRQLFRESGGGTHSDSSTAGSQSWQDVVTDRFHH
jgi:hypothetical protein